MRRYAIIAAGLAALCGGAGAVAVSASAAPKAEPRAVVRGLVCHRELDPPARWVSVTAVMRPLKGTKKMQLRFQLQSRAKGASSFGFVTGGDLGTWVSPTSPATLGQRAGDVWKFTKPIVGLAAPATYRFRVSFRWLGARGRVLGTAVHFSSTCFQPESRPDLLVQSITVQPVTGRPHVNRYVAVIRNVGATPAVGPFEILFTPGGSLAVQTVTVSQLAAHSKHAYSFLGPVCSPAAATTVTVDPEDKVDDLDRSNNSKTAVCPGT